MLVKGTNRADRTETIDTGQRLTSQPLLPQHIDQIQQSTDGYRLYPWHCLGDGKIFSGYESLANWIADQQTIVIDGFSAVLWHQVRDNLAEIFATKDITVQWIDVAQAMLTPPEIERLVQPFLGDPESLWGTRCTLDLADFFDHAKLKKLSRVPAKVQVPAREQVPAKEQVQTKGQMQAKEQIQASVKVNASTNQLNIFYGTGASLVDADDASIIYIDIPKNEIQYRSRAGTVFNLGFEEALSSQEMYKRYYFIDWVVLGMHKQSLLKKATIFADTQWMNEINWMFGDNLMAVLRHISCSPLRVRPWFEAGAWGGQWMKNKFRDLSKDEINYAWSFEMILPENGIVFESDGNLLELSFDFLMFAQGADVIGKHARFFGTEFPIRFNFLDTWNGGNLSIQCHPSLQYIREHFGERITQDETYYILDCKDDASVYLGFNDDIDPQHFRMALENSREQNEAIEITDYVQLHKAHKHDLFLIPNGTVHSAGIDNLVLEISATPYIFTFKMYDWVRLDLNGEPRTINLQHAFNNLDFSRKGESVRSELISKPKVIANGNDWQLIHLPTHAQHFYDVHRVEFETELTIETKESCHVLMLVEGSSVIIETGAAGQQLFYYAETILVPAATGSYKLINRGDTKAKMIKAFLKEEIDFLR